MSLEIKNVTKKYAKKLVLDNISLSCPKGSIIGLLGLNGAGKTTLFNIIAGLEYYTGSISKYNKNDIAYMPTSKLFFKNMRLIDAINYYNDFYINFDCIKAKQELTSLGHDLNMLCKNLSKGQYRYFMFVLTMCRQSQVYLLDEPFSNVDILHREMIVSSIIDNCSPDKIIIVSSHELEQLKSLFSHIVIINNTKISSLYDVEMLREDSKKDIETIYRENVIC